jgi:hypothetical protein
MVSFQDFYPYSRAFTVMHSQGGRSIEHCAVVQRELTREKESLAISEADERAS